MPLRRSSSSRAAATATVVALVFLAVAANARWTILAGAWVTTTTSWSSFPRRDHRNPASNPAVPLARTASASTAVSTRSPPRIREGEPGITAGVRKGDSCLHSSVVSPHRADVGDGCIDDDNDDDFITDNVNDNDNEYEYEYEYEYAVDPGKDLRRQRESMERLSELLEAEPRGLLRFEIEEETGLRGMHLNRPVEEDEIVLKIPVDSCLTDDRSPSWLHDHVTNDPHRRATRLAACWIDLHLTHKQQQQQQIDNREPPTESDRLRRGHEVWCSLLPDPEHLRASLPVHWPETTLSNARSTALELSVDSAFFARAEAVDDLVRGMQRSPRYADLFGAKNEVDTHRRLNDLAHRALDLVQTRSCRLDDDEDEMDASIRSEDGLPVRTSRGALAPVFDFINHGYRNTGAGNSRYGLEVDGEREYLVVRALRDLAPDEEIRIDYGESSRPAWKCLLSYGFVPAYVQTAEDAAGGENLAEVYMKGVRYEVADDSVPMAMVADATPRPRIDRDETDPEQPTEAPMLTPDIALRIAERIADAAYYLLLEPEQILDENDGMEPFEEEEEDDTTTPFEVISKQLAASLRWSQHKILLTCAAGLTHYAKEHKKAKEKEESSYQ